MDQSTTDRLAELREARREVIATGREIDRKAKAAKVALGLDRAEDLIDAEILRLLQEANIPTAYFPNGDQLQRTVNTRVEVTDWPAYMEWVTQQRNWQLVQQLPGKNAVIAVAQAELDRQLGALPGNDGATILDYFKPENTTALPPIPTVPGVRIVPRYTVKDVKKRGSS